MRNLLLVLAFLFLSACSNTWHGVKEDTNNAAEWTKEKINNGATYVKEKTE
ncbi:MAG: hypothetical protein K5978_05270 [Campylobacter sp.]|nr:hypothetical protein [Campylobacter sp.]